METYKIRNTLDCMELIKLDIYPITYRDGSWIFEKNGKLILALNAINNNKKEVVKDVWASFMDNNPELVNKVLDKILDSKEQ